MSDDSQNNGNNGSNRNNRDDPFNFFKLSPEPGSSGNGNKKWPKIPVWAIILGIFAVMVAVNYFMLSKSDSLIPFSEFKNRVASGEITRVQISSTYFTGFTGNEQSLTTKKPAFDFLSSSGSHSKAYRTVAFLPKISSSCSTARRSLLDSGRREQLSYRFYFPVDPSVRHFLLHVALLDETHGRLR
jgi:hypothetical protein